MYHFVSFRSFRLHMKEKSDRRAENPARIRTDDFFIQLYNMFYLVEFISISDGLKWPCQRERLQWIYLAIHRNSKRVSYIA